MRSFNKDIGNYGENIASEHLKSLGYTILERNYRCKLGEIDIIVSCGNYVCFIEVKTRYVKLFGLPCDAVNIVKQHKILRTAKYYIMNKKFMNLNYRFDVIEVVLNYENNNFVINYIQDAFQG